MDKKTIIIILLIILIVILVAMFATVSMSNNSSTYERVNLSSTCSLELPRIHFEESTSNSNGGNSYVQVNTDYKQLSSSNLIVGYMKMENSLGIYGDGGFNMADQFKAGHTDWYSRTVSNDATGETLLVMGKDKEQVDHIADSIQFSTGNATNSTKNTSQSNSNSKNTTNDPIVGYLGDGTPVHQSEYSKYVDKQPIYTFNPSDPVQMSEMQDKMAEAERKMSDGGQSPSPQEGSGSSQSYEQTYSSGSGMSSEGSVVTTTAG